MRLRFVALVVAPVLTLAACATAPVAPRAPAADTAACGADRYSGLTGQDATALERVLILGQVRVIRPGDGVTADLRPARLNFEIDEVGRIARIYCG